jgi:sigma-B regulation protein RsbU (phosphoserine phosphatase)
MTTHSTSSAGSEKEPEKILLVDDNPTNLQVLFQTLEGRDYSLLVAKNGETALSIARKALPELMLLDIMMPGIDGYEVCHQLKQDPATREIAVIFLSALTETQDKVRGLDLGAVDYITKPFQPDEVIARVNTHLTIHRLRREVQEQRDELEHELETVSDVQRDLLPKQLPEIPGVKIAAYYKTSRYAGGDYYDVLKISDGELGFLVADAEGHSTPAAVRMAMTCTLFRAYPGLPVQPDDVLTHLNEHLCKVVGNSFITAVYGVYHAENQMLRVTTAGHSPPLLYRPSDGKTTEVSCEGTYVMGFQPYDDVPVSEVKLQAGDRLLFYTDGPTERFSPEREMYGVERLGQQLSQDYGGDPKEILNGIVKDVDAFAGGLPADDDQTLVLFIVE